MFKRPVVKRRPYIEPVSPWIAKIQGLIANGKLEHVDTDEKGRKVYRLKDEGLEKPRKHLLL